jgi:uncharacterized protein YecE (DUF72 family)
MIYFQCLGLSLLIGTSGWSYDDWVGPFYSKKTGKFTQYSNIFSTTEINSTFYSYPSTGLILGLLRNSPPGFVFSAKLPKLITHDKWLRLGDGVLDDTYRFLELMQPLAEKLGPILIQLRPKFNYDDHFENLEAYFEVIPRNYEWAVEFRNHSWLRNETFELLSKFNVAYTVVDEPLIPSEIHITADFSYIRWHGHGENLWYDYQYSGEQLDEWKPRVIEIVGKTRRTYGYFNNHFRANAVKNAVEMLNRLNMSTPEQNLALEMITKSQGNKGRPAGVQPLEAFNVDDDDLSVADHLTRFTDTGRLARGENINNNDLEIIESSEHLVKASLRGYYLEVDFNNRAIKHNCDDWRKGADRKRICKHLVKLFLSLPPSKAMTILTRIWSEKDLWVFEK